MRILFLAFAFSLLTTLAANAQCGVASWYGGKDGLNGRPTASGEIFNTNKMTAAHPTLPFGTKVKVTSQATGKHVVVRINDRGPFHKGRIIDLSRAAAHAIGMDGIGKVCVERIM